MKNIARWGLMRNVNTENIQEHSHQAACIAHCLAAIARSVYGKDISPERAAVCALYHDASEVITGDLPTPIKYYNSEIRDSYKSVERVAEEKLFSMLPDELKPEFRDYFLQSDYDAEIWRIVKAADKLCAYLKCVEELRMGNAEFNKAHDSIKAELDAMDMPEVAYFMRMFVPGFSLTIDELG